MLEKEFQIFGKDSMMFFKGSMMYERVFVKGAKKKSLPVLRLRATTMNNYENKCS